MFDSIEDAVREIKRGRFVILVDDEDRENEGDLVMGAEKTTPDANNFMAKNARGLICLALTPERAEGRGAQASRANQGVGGPRPPCRAVPGRGALRDHERRWNDGPGTGADGVCPATQAQNGH